MIGLPSARTVVGWLLLAGGAAAALGAAYVQGRGDGRAGCEAETAREERIGALAAAQAASAAAAAISTIEVRNVTIRQQLEREVVTREVFRDCRSGADAVRLLNDTIGAGTDGGPGRPGGGGVPAAAAADR